MKLSFFVKLEEKSQADSCRKISPYELKVKNDTEINMRKHKDLNFQIKITKNENPQSQQVTTTDREL